MRYLFRIDWLAVTALCDRPNGLFDEERGIWQQLIVRLLGKYKFIFVWCVEMNRFKRCTSSKSAMMDPGPRSMWVKCHRTHSSVSISISIYPAIHSFSYFPVWDELNEIWIKDIFCAHAAWHSPMNHIKGPPGTALAFSSESRLPRRLKIEFERHVFTLCAWDIRPYLNGRKLCAEDGGWPSGPGGWSWS